MRIGIDIDCVCNNLVDEWLLRLNTKYNLNIKCEDITSYNIRPFFPTLTSEEIYEPLYDDNMWNSLIPIDESIKYMKQLKDDGHDIKLITATNVKSMPIKCNWILKHYPFMDEKDIWMVFDKSWISADVLLDDCMENLYGKNYLGICYAQPWNKTYTGLRVNNWKDFYNIIKNIRGDL